MNLMIYFLIKYDQIKWKKQQECDKIKCDLKKKSGE